MGDEGLGDGAAVDELLMVLARTESAGGQSGYRVGEKLGRYELGRVLGDGGFGVVFEARDPELGRNVAIKVLRLDAQADEASGRRLLREAKAMAQLKHPNVVTVYEVGVAGERVFLAMELVEGTSLRHWLRARPRPWREVLARFLDAGRGLAAAHAAGLVHRDFKPDNVLVGDDGRVRVADFGLARRADEPDAGGSGPAGEGGLDQLTVAGAAVGTPLYMAPEQHRGEPPDQRTDQFSFCVALYEALQGRMPFAGSDRAALRDAVLAGTLRPPRRGPRFVRRALRRGLSAAPAARFPSVAALLAALSLERHARRLRLAVGLALALVLVGASGALVRAREQARSQVCMGGPGVFATAWNDGRRRRIYDAFLASGARHAERAYLTTAGQLDAYRDRFVAAYRDACEATQLRREQSSEVQDLRMACLTGRVAEVRTLTDVLAAADADVVDADVLGARPLPDLGACADVPRLRDEGPAPADRALFGRVQAVRASIVQAEVARIVSRPGMLERGEAVLAAARATGYRPVIAEAQVEQGRALERAGRFADAEAALFAALALATSERRAEVAAAAAAYLAIDIGRVQARYDEGRRWGQLALALIGDRELPARAASAWFALGLIDKAQGRFDEATASFGRALALRERLAPQSVQVAEVLNSLGGVALEQGRLDDAERSYRRAYEIWAAWSPSRPANTAGHSLALVAHLRGRNHEAAALLAAMLAEASAREPDNVPTAKLMHDLAEVRLALGEDDEAAALLARALAICERRQGPDHPDTANVVELLADVALRRGDLDAARAGLERAVASIERGRGKAADATRMRLALADVARRQRRFADAHALLEPLAAARPEERATGRALDLLGATLLDEGRPAAALPHLERAVAILDVAGEQPQGRASALLHLGAARLALGQAELALAPLERALALALHREAAAADAAPFQMALARALWEGHGDRRRALAVAHAAQAALATAGPGHAAERAEVARWLADVKAR